MAYNKIIYKGDTLIDLTADTVTPETLAEGVTAHAKNGEIITGRATGGSAKLGELTVGANGEYEASVYGVLDTITEICNGDNITLDMAGEPCWKLNTLIPSDIDAFIRGSYMQIVKTDGTVFFEAPFVEFDRQGSIADNGFIMLMNQKTYSIVLIIKDPSMFESAMGMQFGFEQGVYFADAGRMVTSSRYATVTLPINSTVDAYSKVIVDVNTGGLDWYTTSDNIHVASMGGDSLIISNNEITSSITGLIRKCTRALIPNGPTSIGAMAFSDCYDLTSIVIPDSVTAIGYSAFNGCENLVSITIPDSVVSIGNDAFAYTPWLSAKRQENPVVIVNNILVDGKTCSGEVVIPDGVTSIGENAFYGCSKLESIVIPDSVILINQLAFGNCTVLGSITYTGTIAQWKAIDKHESWLGLYSNPPATYVQCSDGKVAI